MARNLLLSRDEAELLDTLLEDYIERGGTDVRAHDLALELQQIWGMASFERRKEIESVRVQPH